MIMGMGIFIGCGYGSHIGIAAATLVGVSFVRFKVAGVCRQCFQAGRKKNGLNLLKF
jgi:hypothetical protein